MPLRRQGHGGGSSDHSRSSRQYIPERSPDETGEAASA